MFFVAPGVLILYYDYLPTNVLLPILLLLLVHTCILLVFSFRQCIKIIVVYKTSLLYVVWVW